MGRIRRPSILLSSQRGVSIIELIVTLLIAGILFAVAIPSFGEMRRSMNKGTALRQLDSDLRRAHATSLAKGAHVIFNTVPGVGYTIGIDYAPYSGDAETNPEPDEILYTTELPQGFSLTVWDPIMFNARGFVINRWGWPSGGGGALNDGENAFASFTVSPSGFAEYWHW